MSTNFTAEAGASLRRGVDGNNAAQSNDFGATWSVSAAPTDTFQFAVDATAAPAIPFHTHALPGLLGVTGLLALRKFRPPQTAEAGGVARSVFATSAESAIRPTPSLSSPPKSKRQCRRAIRLRALEI